MPPKTYWWITGWFLITAPLMIWDAGYCLMRPRSMPGGDLHRFWRFYATYGSVDKIYGRNAYDNGDGFAGAAAIMNLLEISLNLIYLFLVYIFPSPSAPIFGYTGATMTFAKTALYCGQEIFCGWCATGHNDRAMQFGIWILPNIVWTFFCLAIMNTLGGDMSEALAGKALSGGASKALTGETSKTKALSDGAERENKTKTQ